MSIVHEKTYMRYRDMRDEHTKVPGTAGRVTLWEMYKISYTYMVTKMNVRGEEISDTGSDVSFTCCVIDQ